MLNEMKTEKEKKKQKRNPLTQTVAKASSRRNRSTLHILYKFSNNFHLVFSHLPLNVLSSSFALFMYLVLVICVIYVYLNYSNSKGDINLMEHAKWTLEFSIFEWSSFHSKANDATTRLRCFIFHPKHSTVVQYIERDRDDKVES